MYWPHRHYGFLSRFEARLVMKQNFTVTFKTLEKDSDKEIEQTGIWIDNVIATHNTGVIEHCALVLVSTKLFRINFNKLTVVG